MGLPEHLEALKWESDYQTLLAYDKTWWPWWYGWRLWPLVRLGDDEYLRRTLLLGPIVFPLWRCRCKDCHERYASIKAQVEA